MRVKHVGIAKTVETTSLDVGNPHLGRIAQGFQTHCIFGLPTLDQSQALAQYFACVLIATGRNQLLHKAGLMVGKDNIPGWHDGLFHQVYVLAYYAIASKTTR